MGNTENQSVGVGRRLLINVGLNFGAQAVVLILNFATIPFVVHRLGAELFGIVVLVQTIGGFAGVLNFGIGRALTRYVSGLYWKNDNEGINDFFQTAWTLCLVAGLASIAFIIGTSRSIGDLFFQGALGTTPDLVSFAIYVAGFALVSSMLLDAIAAIPLAAQRFRLRNILQIAISAIWCLGSVAVLWAGYSVYAVLLVYLFSNVVGVLAYVIASKNIVKGLSFAPRISWGALNKLVAFSLPITLSAASALIVSRMDRLILAHYLPLAAVAFYTLPYLIAEKMSAAVANVTSVVFPFASELFARDAHDKLHDLYIRATKMLNILMLPATVILLAIPWEILKFWLGEEYAENGTTSLILISLSVYLNALTAIPTMISLATGRAWLCSSFALLTSIINISACFILIPQYGVIGAAAALLVSHVGVVPFIYVVNRSIDLSIWQFVSQTLVRPLMCAAIQFGALYELRTYINDVTSLLLVCVASSLVYCVAALCIAATRQEKLSLLLMLREILSGSASSK